MTDVGRGAGLGPFASRLAGRWLAEDPARRHRCLHGTLVSADLSGFTAMSEGLAARGREGSERLTLTVNGCFTALIDAAGREGGDVLKFGGDALLLWFDGEGHPERAARAAARMQRAMGAARFLRAGLRMSVGAHTGAFELFLVGRREWRELVAAGPAVTRTVDLEAAAAPGEILISEAVAAELPPSWCGEPRAAGLVLDRAAVPLPRRAPSVGPVAQPDVTALVAPRLRADVDALAGTGGEHRLATVVFGELEGTDASVAAGGEAFTDSVDALVHAAQELSERFGVQFLYTDVIADGIKLICSAGAPVSTSDDEEAGLRFATALVGGDPKAKLRAGVHRGRVFAGFLGSPTRRTYTVMGDPVNLAARLMGRAEPGQVVASAEVVAASRAVFATVDLPPFLVKGKAEPIRAHVVGAPTGERRERADAGPDDVPMVGREAEVALLRDAIGRATAGAGEVVELVGDAGIGKTRLLRAVDDDPRVMIRVATECQPYDALSPFASIRPLLRQALGIPVEASSAEAGRSLLRVTARLAPGLEPLLPLLAIPVGADVPDTEEAFAIAEEFRATRMHEAVVELLTAALPSPTMLAVEDVYYVDDASLRLLHAIAEAVPDRPWLLAVTRRPEGPGLVAGPVPGTVVKLQPLEDGVAAQLAEAAASGRGIGSLELDTMAQRSGGNPLFVLQLVEAAGAGVAADDLPESVERLVATRIDRLDPADRALLRQAAVIGRVFHTSLLNMWRSAEGSPLVAPQRWAALSDLVEPEGDRRWRFRHALFRDVAYEGLPFARRKRMHAAVGELLEAGAAGEPDVALLSQHFWLAGDAERTWRYSVAAGDAAWARFAVTEAIAAYQRALRSRRSAKSADGGAVAAVAEALGDALERQARYDEAEWAYRLALRSRRKGALSDDRARLLRKRGDLHERAGKYDAALRCYTRARQMVAASPTTTELARLAVAYAGVRYRQGHHDEVAAWAGRAIDEARHGDDPVVEAHAKALLVLAAAHGAATDGEAVGLEALAVFEEVGDAHRAAKILNNLGMLAYYDGRWDLAVRRYRASAERFEAAGDVDGVTLTLNNLGEILSDQGHFDPAADALRKAHRGWSSAKHALGMAVASSNLGRLAARSGSVADALEQLTTALETFRGIGAGAFVMETLARMAEAHVVAGDPRAALATIDESAAEDLREAAHATTETLLARCAGWAHLQLGDTASATTEMSEALRRARSSGSPYELALSLIALRALSKHVALDTGDEALDPGPILDGLGVIAVVDVPEPA